MFLDTCALIWLAQGGGPLSSTARDRINISAIVYVSAISGFEIGVKFNKGKINLPAKPQDWFLNVLDHHSLHIYPLTLEVCIRSTELPMIHRDPCDRMIIASALIAEMPIVTHDPCFHGYGIEIIE